MCVTCLKCIEKSKIYVTYELLFVIRFLNIKSTKPTNICRRRCEVYGENVVRDSMVRKRRDCSTKAVQMFMMKSLVNDDRKSKGNAMTLKTGDLSWCHLSIDFPGVPYFLYKILSKKFNFPKYYVCVCVSEIITG